MNENLVNWNVCGLNRRARCKTVKELVRSEKVSILCLQETKLNDVNKTFMLDMLGLNFDYVALSVVHTQGGILVAWDVNVWDISNPVLGSHSIIVLVIL